MTPRGGSVAAAAVCSAPGPPSLPRGSPAAVRAKHRCVV